MPLAGTSVTLAGQPSKVGGTVARVLGWIVLAGGLLLAGLFVVVFMAINAAAAAGWVGGSVAFLAILFAALLLRGGKQLVKSGDSEELATKKQAIFALANTRGGTLRAVDVAQMLHVSPDEGDAILTQLAKEDSDRVGVDIDDDGTLLFRFSTAQWASVASSGMAPNGMAPNAPTHVRVAPPMQVGDAPPPVYEEQLDDPAAARKQAR